LPIRKSEKIVRIVFVVIVPLLLLMQSACVHANWARFRIRHGMTVNEALQVSGDWTWAPAHSERPAPEPAVDLPFNQRFIFDGQGQPEQFASLNEVAQALGEQMSGHPWHVAYVFGGPSSFRLHCLFRRAGKGTKRLGHLVGGLSARICTFAPNVTV
jgi:hypothetical protein